MRSLGIAGTTLAMLFALAISTASATDGVSSDGAHRVAEGSASDDFAEASSQCLESPEAHIDQATEGEELEALSDYAETGPYGRPVFTGEDRPLQERLQVVAGSKSSTGSGRLLTFRVVAEDGLEVDAVCFGLAVEDVLWDERGWVGGGRVAFERVDGPVYDFTIILASPDATDELCTPLRTGGVLSCRKQGNIIVNAWRWERGASAFGSDLTAYRSYLINHEVGHLLGRSHRSCPGSGQPAPVMMQQTKGVGDCVANGWPLSSELP